jgi:hypothetical protein
MAGSMFRERDGEVSTMRVLTAFVVISVVGTWCALSILQGQLIEMPGWAAGLAASTMGAKAWQRGREN